MASSSTTTTTTMVRPPPPPQPPKNRPPPPKTRPPPPPPTSKPGSSVSSAGVNGGRKPPPPPPPPARKPEAASFAVVNTKKRSIEEEEEEAASISRTVTDEAPVSKKQQKRHGNTGISSVNHLHIKAPVVLRDVTVFQKKHQVGEGTYGCVSCANGGGGECLTCLCLPFEGNGGGNDDTGSCPLKEIVTSKVQPAYINLHDTISGALFFVVCAFEETSYYITTPSYHVVAVHYLELADQGDIPKNVFMVFEYLEFDLTGIIETPEIKITQDHIKSWSKQLLKGVHYMHTNKIIHRDLKSSNLLINRRGELKIADWGLARSWNSEMKRLTNRVITLWYRPPELLLGCINYSTKIDMWSVGCIIAEMFRRGGLLKGSSEASQLDLIFRVMGHPTTEDWPNINKMCPLWKNYEPKSSDEVLPRRLREELKNRLPAAATSWMTPHAMDMIDNLLAYNPDKRWSAAQALTAEWFFDNPLVKTADQLNMKFGVDSAHEWEARKKHKEMMAQRKARAEQLAGGRNVARPPPPPPQSLAR
eukprot:scaffold358_cov207-Alexandrium_tamarense.AAC.35